MIAAVVISILVIVIILIIGGRMKRTNDRNNAIVIQCPAWMDSKFQARVQIPTLTQGSSRMLYVVLFHCSKWIT